MSNADKLFEQLGYTERYEEDYGAVICFKKSSGVILKFDLEEMGFTKLLDVGQNSLKIRMLVSFKELKAINMKCQELRVG